MPRRNFLWLIAVAVVSLVCYQKVQGNRYGRVVADAMDQIERRDAKPVDSEELLEGAIKGMISRLDDPYSEYESPKMLSELNETLQQRFAGIGIEILVDPESKQLTVITPLVGTPAHRAGILAGDRILRIDGTGTQDLTQEEAVKRMRGKAGEPVTLSVLHEGEEKPVDLKIVREVINVDTVLGDTRNPDGSWNFFLEGHDHIGYVRISTFGEKTVKELKDAMQTLSEHDMRGLVLDLRDDPGGLLRTAVEVCDLFIDSGEIVTTVGRDGRALRVYEASGQGPYVHFPMAVVVNHYSASASEIVAACLQDHHRAVVVGERSWGKGTVQEVIDLESGYGALRLTTSKYQRPDHQKNIHREKNSRESDDWGVKPDPSYDVPVEGGQFAKLKLQRLRRDMHKRGGNGASPAGNGNEPFVDPQVEKAVEYIEKQLQGEKSP